MQPRLRLPLRFAAAATTPAGDAVAATVLDIVATKTGYPQDMLELDLDLEADLGVDTVKQAETFPAMREAFGIPFQEGLSLRDYPTLESVIGFVYTMRPDLKKKTGIGVGIGRRAAAPPAPSVDPLTRSPLPAFVKTIGTLEDADRCPRRVPVPSCAPGDRPLQAHRRVARRGQPGGRDDGPRRRGQGAGRAAAEDGRRSSWRSNRALPPIELDRRLQGWLAEGPIQGVYWLPALDVEPALEEMGLAEWRENNRVRVKNLYTRHAALYDWRRRAGPLPDLGHPAWRPARLRRDRRHGTAGRRGVGFTKAYNVEQGLRDAGKGVIVKAVDFEISRKTAEPADLLIAETLFDPGVVEVGYHDGLRYTVTLDEKPARDGNPGMVLDKTAVFVVTGAAGGITSAIVTDLAVASRGIFYLLDLVPAPARDDENVRLFRSDKDALKRTLIDEAKAEGEKPTPATIDKQIVGIERSEAALRAIESVEAAGGTAHYFSLTCVTATRCTGWSTTSAAATARSTCCSTRRHADRPHAAQQGAEPVRPGLRHQGRRLLQPAQGGQGDAHRRDGELQLGGRTLRQQRPERLLERRTTCSARSAAACGTWRPETRGIAIDWTAWGEIGMASRGSVPAIMEALGVDMLPPESGVPTIRRELTYGGTRGEMLVAGRLGRLDGGEGPERRPRRRQDQRDAWHSASAADGGQGQGGTLFGGIEVETTLDPAQQPFLFDHVADEGGRGCRV